MSVDVLDDEDDPIPPWHGGRGYWPTSDAMPTPKEQSDELRCPPGQRRAYAAGGEYFCEKENPLMGVEILEEDVGDFGVLSPPPVTSFVSAAVPTFVSAPAKAPSGKPLPLPDAQGPMPWMGKGAPTYQDLHPQKDFSPSSVPASDQAKPGAPSASYEVTPYDLLPSAVSSGGRDPLAQKSCQPCERAEWDEEAGEVLCKKIEGCVAATFDEDLSHEFSGDLGQRMYFPTQTMYVPPSCPPGSQWMYSRKYGRFACIKRPSGYLSGLDADPNKSCRRGYTWSERRKECIQDPWTIGVPTPTFVPQQPLRGLDAAPATAADLLNALNYGRKNADEFQKRIVKLMQNKALTLGVYKEYRAWVAQQVKLRQDFVAMMRSNPRFASVVAEQLGLSVPAAILKIEGSIIPNVAWKKGQVFSDGTLSGFGVLPLIAAGWALGTIAVATMGAFGISKLTASDIARNKELTSRIDGTTSAMLKATEGLPPKERAAAIQKMTEAMAKGGAFQPPPAEEGMFDKIKSAIAQPIGIAATVGLLYAGVRYGLPLLKKAKR